MRTCGHGPKVTLVLPLHTSVHGFILCLEPCKPKFLTHPSPSQPYEGRAITVPVLQIKTLRHRRRLEYLAQGRSAGWRGAGTLTRQSGSEL